MDSLWAQILSLLVGALLGVAATVVVQPYIEDPLQNVMLKVLGSKAPRPREKLAGRWEMRWWKDGERELPPTKTVLRQFGNRVDGDFAYNNRTYYLRGRVARDSVITGTYYDSRTGHTYHGAFQLTVAVNERTMEGKWIGFNRRNIVISGPWEWRREGEAKFPSEYARESPPDHTDSGAIPANNSASAGTGVVSETRPAGS